MKQSDFTYLVSKGKRRGLVYNIGVRHDPDLNNVESFATILFFQLRDGTRVEVAKIDDSAHNGEEEIHIDCYYREVGVHIKQFDTDITDWMEAEEYLNENWKRFADQYYENHGREPRTDGANI